MAAKKKARRRAKPKASISKSAFIRSQRSSMSAKQVVAQAKKRGMKLSETYVYNIRRSARLKAAGRSGRARSAGGGSTEAQFRKLALGLGLERSRALLDDIERKLDALIAGR